MHIVVVNRTDVKAETWTAKYIYMVLYMCKISIGMQWCLALQYLFLYGPEVLPALVVRVEDEKLHRPRHLIEAHAQDSVRVYTPTCKTYTKHACTGAHI